MCSFLNVILNKKEIVPIRQTENIVIYANGYDLRTFYH